MKLRQIVVSDFCIRKYSENNLDLMNFYNAAVTETDRYIFSVTILVSSCFCYLNKKKKTNLSNLMFDYENRNYLQFFRIGSI